MADDEQRWEPGHAPRMWPFWMASSVAVLASALVLATAFFWLDHSLIPPAAAGTSSADRTLNVFKSAVALATFAGAVLAGVYAYRKQKLTEGDAKRADAEQLLSRFGKASEQLGHESPAVRLAGVHAMSSLADDWVQQRQLCIDVLTVYLQVPYEADPDKRDYLHGEMIVRRTIVRLIRDHLRPGFSRVSWQGMNFRFEDAIFYGGDLTGAHFVSGKVSFHRARFREGNFYLSDAVFSGARIWFTEATVEGGRVSFANAKMTGGLLDFTGASVTSGEVVLKGFDHQGGELVAGSPAALFEEAKSAPQQ
ncbi:pentapeptide repeat-containing protein [Actinoplanes auranticolor]|uniref:Pentapeptide repeat protein n=1 Tax=Actinoplanes auranticolor TaxID=47988 RepID=A0A919VZS0_9ACTN|nr:pentapeptide repeat-containing protein [Actinoplanes auranticolor]GIM74893.1 hypothetical protein Aau02nite_63180 [Actinoplanes auranticolor]